MIKAKLREQYRGLSRNELLDKAYELGFNYGKISGFCSQDVVATIHELIDIDDVVVRVANSVAGGMLGRVTGACGTLVGGTMVLDYFFGRQAAEMSHQESVPANMVTCWAGIGVARLLYDWFLKEYGVIYCGHLQQKLYGRIYWLEDPHQHKEKDILDKSLASSDPEKTCYNLVGSAARKVMEILLDKGAIEL